VNIPHSGIERTKLFDFLAECGAVKLCETRTPAGEMENTWFRFGARPMLVVLEEYEPIKLFGPRTIIERIEKEFKKE
jgi:hypothetical protein